MVVFLGFIDSFISLIGPFGSSISLRFEQLPFSSSKIFPLIIVCKFFHIL